MRIPNAIPFTSRILSVALTLAVAAYTHDAFIRHLKASYPPSPLSLRKPLAGLPKRLGGWQGVDVPPASVFADEHFARVYRHTVTTQKVTVNISYSVRGEDRKHNPLLCMDVAGYQEDPTWRSSIPVKGHAVPIQQFRLHKPGDICLAFYWHYTLKSSNPSETGRLGKLYQRFHTLPSSVSVAAFTPYFTEDDKEGAHELVRLLDAALQSHVGPDAVRGSDNAPIMVIGDDGLRSAKHNRSER